MSEEYQNEFIENRKKMFDKMSDAEKAQMMKDFKMPSKEDLMKMVDGMKGVSEEHKEKLREHLIKRSYFESPDPDGEVLSSTNAATTYELVTLVIYVIMVLSFIAVCAFFGYKLYRSLTEKDRKREEKLKAKQSKKKK